MHAVKVLLLVLVGGLVLATGLFAFVPSTRPAIVKKWFLQMAGFSPATSPEDALDKLKKALEKRNYEAAELYVTGDYLEWLQKGGKDAKELVTAVDELSSVMKTTGTNSDHVDLALFKLDPFPPFKVEDVKKSENGATARLSWVEDLSRFKGVKGMADYKISPLMLNSLLPSALLSRLDVTVKNLDGVWKVELPVQIGERHMRECVEALRKNATNYRNALQNVKDKIKNDKAVKQEFETEFRTNLEKAN